MNELEAARRVIEYLERCKDRYAIKIMQSADPELIFRFTAGIADAIKVQELE